MLVYAESTHKLESELILFDDLLQSKLLEMDSKEVSKYESNKKMYEACKKALENI